MRSRVRSSGPIPIRPRSLAVTTSFGASEIRCSAAAFKDPAWDLLLGLYIARAEGRSISVKAAVILAATSSTTGLRVIEELVADGVVTRTPAPERRGSYREKGQTARTASKIT